MEAGHTENRLIAGITKERALKYAERIRQKYPQIEIASLPGGKRN